MSCVHGLRSASSDPGAGTGTHRCNCGELSMSMQSTRPPLLSDLAPRAELALPSCGLPPTMRGSVDFGVRPEVGGLSMDVAVWQGDIRHTDSVAIQHPPSEEGIARELRRIIPTLVHKVWADGLSAQGDGFTPDWARINSLEEGLDMSIKDEET